MSPRRLDTGYVPHFKKFEQVDEIAIQFIHPKCARAILVLEMGVAARWMWAYGICPGCEKYVALKFAPEHRSFVEPKV